MKQLLTLAALLAAVALGYALFVRMRAPQPVTRQGESKYICSMAGPDQIYTTEFGTKEECVANCKGGAVVCEETGIDTPVVNTDD